MQQQSSLSSFARILLVDDDVAAVQLTAIALEESVVRAQLSTAGGMREALDVLTTAARGSAALRPDLVLLDLNLRDGSGHDVLAAMKAEPALAAIPVVILSTSSNPADVSRALDLGAARYVVKPTGFDEFVLALDQLQELLPS